MATKKKALGKYQGKDKSQVSAADSSAYYTKAGDNWAKLAGLKNDPVSEGFRDKAVENYYSVLRQTRKGKPGYDKNGNPIKKKGGSIKKAQKGIYKGDPKFVITPDKPFKGDPGFVKTPSDSLIKKYKPKTSKDGYLQYKKGGAVKKSVKSKKK